MGINIRIIERMRTAPPARVFDLEIIERIGSSDK
jgi:hypothetical protein